jgi:hypothetical protein
MRRGGIGELLVSFLFFYFERVTVVEVLTKWTAQDFPKARERLEDLKRSGKNSGPRARERISRSKMTKQQEGECSVM